MSMVLTSTPLWRCTPERNCSIPTISMGRFDVGPLNVSAVDTGLPEGPNLRGWGCEFGGLTSGVGLTVSGLASLAPTREPGGHGSTPILARVLL